MPSNPDGSWTSPVTGKTYSGDAPLSSYDPADLAAARAELNDIATREGGQLGDFEGAYGKITAGGLPETPVVGLDAPGASLDTTNADQQRMRMGSLLADLQQQAATGGGAWEKSLKDATDKASQSVMALGQSQPGSDYASALRNIGNAQGAVAQRAVGQGNMLREQSKLDAQDQISGLLAATGEQDIAQAGEAAQARYGRRALNAAAKEQEARSRAGRRETGAQTINTIGQVASMGIANAMSEGGTVPGKPKVFGNDSRNDVAPAMLTPGEIVIPLSHAGSPEAAADFVRALHRNQPPQHMAEGGDVWQTQGADPLKPGWDLFRGNNLSQAKRQEEEARGPQEAPSLLNGGLLDGSQYAATRRARDVNQNALGAQAAGVGPSAVPQQIQDSTDANLGAAMQAGARGGAPAGDILQGFGALSAAAAGDAAAARAGEQRAGQAGATRAAIGARGADSAMALAEQEAAWRNTQLNAGIGLEQQALLDSIANSNSERTRGRVSATAQGLASYAAASGGGDNYSSDDYAKGGPADLHDRNDLYAGGRVKYATGGKVTDTRGADFVRALRRSGQ